MLRLFLFAAVAALSVPAFGQLPYNERPINYQLQAPLHWQGPQVNDNVKPMGSGAPRYIVMAPQYQGFSPDKYIPSGDRADYPQVNVPYKLREKNYFGGSCSYASTITLLRWQGQYKIAAYVRNHCAGGSNPQVLNQSLDKCGVRYASTWGRQNVKFLEWACKTRRGACIGILGNSGNPYEAQHMLNLVHLDAKWAGFIDNNNTSQIAYMPRAEFIRHWLASGSWAVTPVYSPAPPLPKKSN